MAAIMYMWSLAAMLEICHGGKWTAMLSFSGARR
jgi:hypothetical protein